MVKVMMSYVNSVIFFMNGVKLDKFYINSEFPMLLKTGNLHVNRNIFNTWITVWFMFSVNKY